MKKYMLSAALAFSSVARADEPAASEVEYSGQGDPLATADQALGVANKALRGEAAVAKTVAELERRVAWLEHQVRSGNAHPGNPDLTAAKADLAAAVKADADLAKESAGKAFAEAERAQKAREGAEAAATRAETAAGRAEVSESTVTSATPGANSMNAAEPVDRDAEDTRIYGAAGGGASWLFRQASYTEGSVRYQETDELSSGMLLALGELGYRWGQKGRMNVGARGTGAYNVGGGSALTGEVVFGSFLEQTHSFRLEGFGGIQWETIPTDGTDNYREWRFDIGIGAEFVFADDHVGLLLIGRVLPANDLDDSSGGETALVLRARF